MLLEEIDRNTFTALVLNPFLSEEDLLKLILQDFGVVSREDVKRGRLANVSKQELIETIYDFLLSLLPLRASAVLIIDEAQNLPMPVLEQIRILSNLETDKEKLLQIVLVGQLNLQPLLKAPQMRQLDQRVSIRYQLRPLSRDEVAAYVSHRVMIAGGSASVTFDAKALDIAHCRTGGIPRLLNLVCDRSLLAAYSARSNRVSPEMVSKAAESLELTAGRRSRFGWFSRRASVTVALAGAAVSLAVAGSIMAPALRTVITGDDTPSTTSSADNPSSVNAVAHVKPREVPDAGISVVEHPEQKYSVLTASFPVADMAQAGTDSSLRLDAVVGSLESLGYEVRLVDVELSSRGEWRRVLVGEFTTLAEATAEADRLHRVPAFADAQVITY